MPSAPSPPMSAKKGGGMAPGKLSAEERGEKARQLISRLRSGANGHNQGQTQPQPQPQPQPPPQPQHQHQQQQQHRQHHQQQSSQPQGGSAAGSPVALAFEQESGGSLPGTPGRGRERQGRAEGAASALVGTGPGSGRLSDFWGSPQGSPEAHRQRQPSHQLRRHLLDPSLGATASPPWSPPLTRPHNGAPGWGPMAAPPLADGPTASPHGPVFPNSPISDAGDRQDRPHAPAQQPLMGQGSQGGLPGSLQQSMGAPGGARQGAGERALNGSTEAYPVNTRGGLNAPPPQAREGFLLPPSACIDAADGPGFAGPDGRQRRQGGERGTRSMRQDLGAVRRAFGSSRERAFDSDAHGMGKERWGAPSAGPGPQDILSLEPGHSLGPTSHLDSHRLEAPAPLHAPVSLHGHAHWQAQAASAYCGPSTGGVGACGPPVAAEERRGRSRSKRVDPHAVHRAMHGLGPGAAQAQGQGYTLGGPGCAPSAGGYAQGVPVVEDAEDCLWGEDVGVVCVDEHGCFVSPPGSFGDGEGEGEGEGEGGGSSRDGLDGLWEQHSDEEQSAPVPAPDEVLLPLQDGARLAPIQPEAPQVSAQGGAKTHQGEPGPGQGQGAGQGEGHAGAGSELEKGRSGGSRDDMEVKEHSQAYMDVTLLKDLVRLDSRDDMALQVYRALGEAATPGDIAQRLEMLKQEAIASSKAAMQQRSKEAPSSCGPDGQGSAAAPASGPPPQALQRAAVGLNSDAAKAGGPAAGLGVPHAAGPGAGASAVAPRRKLQRSLEADDAPNPVPAARPGRQARGRRGSDEEKHAVPMPMNGAVAPPQRRRRSLDSDDEPARGAAAAAAASASAAAAAGGAERACSGGGSGGRGGGKLQRSLWEDEASPAGARPVGADQGRPRQSQRGGAGKQRQGQPRGVPSSRPGEDPPREGGASKALGAAPGPFPDVTAAAAGLGANASGGAACRGRGRDGGAAGLAASSGLLRADSRDDIQLFVRHAPWDGPGEGQAVVLERQRSQDDTGISYQPTESHSRAPGETGAPHSPGCTAFGTPAGMGSGAGWGQGKVAVAVAMGPGAFVDSPRSGSPGPAGGSTPSRAAQGHLEEWHARKAGNAPEGYARGRPLGQEEELNGSGRGRPRGAPLHLSPLSGVGQGQGQEEDYGPGSRGSRLKGGGMSGLSPGSPVSGFWSEAGSSNLSSASSSLCEHVPSPQPSSLTRALPGARPLHAVLMSSAEEQHPSAGSGPVSAIRRPRRTSLSGPVGGSPLRSASPSSQGGGSPLPGSAGHRDALGGGGGSQSPIPSPVHGPSAGIARRARRVSRSVPLGESGSAREDGGMEAARRALQSGEAAALALGRLPLSGLGPGPQARQPRAHPQAALGEDLERAARGAEGVAPGGLRRVAGRAEFGGVAAQAQGEEGAGWVPSRGSFEDEDSRGGGGGGSWHKGRSGRAVEEREREREEEGSRVGFLESKGDAQRSLAQWGMAKIQQRVDQLLLKPNTAAVLGIGLRSVGEWYELGDVLGTGNFGTTRVAHSKLSKRAFACKSVPKTALKCKQDIEDVRREHALLEMMRGLPQVPRLKDAFEDAEEVHFVMELCSGGDLFDRLKERRRYAEASAARVLRTVLSVLDFCHERLIVHRDIKPENILLCSRASDSDVKVIDFGIAAQLKPGGKPLTELMGSPLYIAPEVIGGSYGCPADLWSTGVLLYVLLVGGPPFWAKTQAGIMKAIKEARPNLEKPYLSEGAKDLLGRLLTRDPARRITARAALDHPWLVSLAAE